MTPPLEARGWSGAAARWVPRLVLGTFAALIVAVVTLSPPGVAPFELQVTMTASASGTLQVFYDRGRGLSEAESVTARIRRSTEPVTYRLPLPAGDYLHLRIDPNDRGGEYRLSDMRIITAAGRPVASIPLNELRPVMDADLTTTANSATVKVPSGAVDPQLLFSPRETVALHVEQARARRLLGAVLAALAGVVAALIFERLPRERLRLPPTLRRRSPAALILLASAAASLAATYPLLAGRSLVSPNNGPTAFFSDEPPFVYGSDDLAIENARGTDVGSIMWNILPYVVPQWDALAAGELPLWNRYNGIGVPLWGQGQLFFLSPLHLAALSLGDPAAYADTAFVGARMIFASGVGLATFTASGSGLAGIVAAICAPFIGYFSFRFNHPAYFSIVYAPWILWAYFRLAGQQSLRRLTCAGIPLAIASALQLCGSTPKEGAVAFIAAQATGMCALTLASGTGAIRLARIAAAGIAVTVAVLVAAPHWLIFLDTLSRSYTSYDAPSVVYAGWHEIAALALGPWSPGMPYPSINGMTAVLAVATLGGLRAIADKRSVLAAALGAMVFVALACGALPGSLMVRVPLLANIHHTWNAFLSGALTPLLVLAGASVVVLERAPRAAMAGAAAGTLGFVLAVAPGTVHDRPLPPSILAISLLPGVSLAALCIVARSSKATTAVGPAVLLVGAIALFPGGLQLETGIRTLDEVLLQPRRRADLDRTPPSVAAARARAGTEPFRVTALDDVLFQGVQSFFRLEGIGGPDALQLPEPRELSDAAGIYRTDWDWRTPIRRSDLTTAKAYFDMLGVRFVFGHAEQLTEKLPLSGPDLVHVMERPSAWPRAFFVDGVRRHESLGEFVAALRAAATPFASVDRADARALEALAPMPNRESMVVPARDYRLTANRTSFVIEAPRAGVAVLAEAFMRDDFAATLNGQPVDYYRVNHALKAVVLPRAGTWSVGFEYRPRLWHVAWAISLAAVVVATAAVLVVAARAVRHRRHTERRAQPA